MLKSDRIKKLMAMALVLMLLALPLVSCLEGSGTSVVGRVGEFDVAYEELYYLAHSYKAGLEAKYGEYSSLSAEESEKFEAELQELVYGNITANHAILTLCAREGLTLGDSSLSSRVDKYVSNVITTDFGGSKSEYRAALREYGMTDHYVRFVASVDLIYSDLVTKFLSEGRLADDDAEVLEIIKRDFVRTWHIMIANDEGDDIVANRALAEEALRKYKNGSMKMYELIGSKYNEDLTLTTLDGFYFTKGSMEKAYEDAAFSLEVGAVSEVVESMGVTSDGKRVSCFYIIQRLALEDEYISANFYELEEAYRDAVVGNMLAMVVDELEFEPNEYCASLVLSELYAPVGENSSLVVIIICAFAVMAVAIGTVSIVKHMRKKRALAKRQA